MIFQERIKMPIRFCLVSLLMTIVLLAGCTSDAINSCTESKAGSGTAEVRIIVGKIGILAKSTPVEMKHLVLKISMNSNGSTIITDTMGLSGNGKYIASKHFSALSAPEVFTLEATTSDENGKIIHSGKTVFTTIPADTVHVSMNLNAIYSMLRVSFNAIPDSVDTVVLGITGVDTLEAASASAASDTIVLTYNYLRADTQGIDYHISLRARGSYYGKDTTLYAADTTVKALSGVDKSHAIVMKWVGPGIPDGAAEITVTIGAVGTTTINTGFTEMGGLSDLVDNLEDGDELTRYRTCWWTYSDKDLKGNSQVIPTNSTVDNPFLPAPGGAQNSAYAARFSYKLDKGNYEYDAYAGIGFHLDQVSGMDISSSTGIRFYFKGSKARIRISSTNIADYGCWGYDIAASPEWKLINLSWSQFNQPQWAVQVPFDRTSVKFISFEVNGQTGDTGTVWVDDIHLPGFLR
jgi:hypothetical protein